LYEALWSTSSVFSAQKNSANSTKRVFIFTNVSDPCQAPGARARAEQKLRDLAENDIVVELFAVHPPAPVAKFDMHTFWTRAILIDDEDSEFRPLNANSLKALTDDLRRRAFKRRSQLAGHIIIGRQQQNCSRIGFRMYSCIRSAETGKAVFLDAATNAPLTCETKWVCFMCLYLSCIVMIDSKCDWISCVRIRRRCWRTFRCARTTRMAVNACTSPKQKCSC
jgi:hypothetical protein